MPVSVLEAQAGESVSHSWAHSMTSGEPHLILLLVFKEDCLSSLTAPLYLFLPMVFSYGKASTGRKE